MKHDVYIKRSKEESLEEVYEWLEARGLGLVAHNQRFGPVCVLNMTAAAIGNRDFLWTFRFSFEHAADAMLFKLTFGGV